MFHFQGQGCDIFRSLSLLISKQIEVFNFLEQEAWLYFPAQQVFFLDWIAILMILLVQHSLFKAIYIDYFQKLIFRFIILIFYCYLAHILVLSLLIRVLLLVLLVMIRIERLVVGFSRFCGNLCRIFGVDHWVCKFRSLFVWS